MKVIIDGKRIEVYTWAELSEAQKILQEAFARKYYPCCAEKEQGKKKNK